MCLSEGGEIGEEGGVGVKICRMKKEVEGPGDGVIEGKRSAKEVGGEQCWVGGSRIGC